MPNPQEFLASLDTWVREAVRTSVGTDVLQNAQTTPTELVERSRGALDAINSGIRAKVVVTPEDLEATVRDAAERAGYTEGTAADASAQMPEEVEEPAKPEKLSPKTAKAEPKKADK